MKLLGGSSRYGDDSLLSVSRYVSQSAGVPISTQVLDLLQSRRSNHLLGIADYYDYGLYDRQLVSRDEIGNYVGWKYENSLNEALNPRDAVLPAVDKLSLHKLLHECNSVSMPRIIGLYLPSGGKVYGSLSSKIMTDPVQLKIFLETNQIWPLYAKPSHLQQAIGCFLLQGYDPRKKHIILGAGSQKSWHYKTHTEYMDNVTGESMDVSAFIDEVVLRRRQFYKPEAGYMFQQVLTAHLDIQNCTGNDSISSLRMVMLNFDEGPKLERARWKVAVGKNSVDNFSAGSRGNLISRVNLANGKVDSPLDGFWPYANNVSHHPDTGKELSGFQVPNWEEARQMSLSVAACFPLMKILHLDIALTDTGPVLMEINDLAGFDILQLHGKGLLSPLVREALLRYANSSKHPWINKLKAIK